MTDKEAIEILQEEHRYCQEPCYVMNAIERAITALREKLEREQNEPLTLEQLRQMDGQPVWVETPGVRKYGRWAIVEGVDTEYGEQTLYLHGDFTCRDYGTTWMAYRHRPAMPGEEQHGV